MFGIPGQEAPPAFFFDREMNYKYGGFPPRRTSVQMSQAAREDGTNVPHEKLSQEVVADEAGYFYIYLSNDSQTGSEAISRYLGTGSMISRYRHLSLISYSRRLRTPWH
jgi:hypothetical protein